MIYLASSWRNHYYPRVLASLKEARIDVYDFREEGAAFDWRDVDAEWRNDPGTRLTYGVDRMKEMLNHPVARAGYLRDFTALEKCDSLILVAPCGRSAHMELGFAIGHYKPTLIYIPESHEPELMYSMALGITGSLDDVVQWAGEVERAALRSKGASLL